MKRLLRGALLLAAVLPLPAAFAAGVDVPDTDGWYRWQTTAAESAARACCHEFKNGVVIRCRCDLDDRGQGLAFDAGTIGGERLLNVYVKVEDGVVKRVRALAADCPADTATPVAELGAVDAEDSIAWLRAALASSPGVAEHSVDAIALHGGGAGLDALIGVIENRDFRRSLREHALFWLAQSDSDDAYEYLDGLLGRR